MQLTYNGVNLATLGTLRVLGKSTQREPVEAPQRERVTYRMRLDFFQQTFQSNWSQIQQLSQALTAQNVTLTWQDDNGTTYENRTVTAGSSELPEDVMTKGGTYWQSITFTFWYYNHNVTSNCLSATCFGLDMGAVSVWRESARETRFDEMHDPRKRVQGTVTASGRYQADTTMPVAQRQAALMALKDRMMATLVQDASGALVFGTFNQAVRIVEFTASVNQPNNYIDWTLSAQFTRYPDESDYALIQVNVETRVARPENITILRLAGTIQGPSQDACTTRVAALASSLVPAGYANTLYDLTPVTVTSESDAVANGAPTGDGSAMIRMTFQLEYRDTSAVAACTFQANGVNAPQLNLGTVDKFAVQFSAVLFDDLRDARRREIGQVEIQGRWFVSDSLAAADQEAALTAQLAQFQGQLQGSPSGVAQYGAVFNQSIRAIRFDPKIDRFSNCIVWTLTGTYTVYPNESDYALIELKAQSRVARPENINYLTLSGTIKGPSQAACQTRLNLMASALAPSSYANTLNDVTSATVTSESNAVANGAPTGDAGGTGVFTEMTFRLEYRDTSSAAACTYQRSGTNTPILTMGTVDQFSIRYVTTLFDEMRNQRKRDGGQVTIGGRWYVSDSLDASAQQAALVAQKAAFEQQFQLGTSGTLIYGAAFNQVVRVIDFNSKVDRFSNCIAWSFTGSYTVFPNEADYALCEFQLGTRNDLTNGTVLKTISGQIGAPTETAARSKLARLQAAVIPAGYTMVRDNTTANTVDTESNLQTTGTNQGEGYSFVRLTIDQEWQATTSGNVLQWSLRVETDTDARSQLVHTIYSGRVVATGADQPTAFAAALQQAQALGANQGTFLIRSVVAENEKLFQTVGAMVFVTVDFSYDYQSKGTQIYLEVTSELAQDNFGQTIQTVSGFVAAETLAAAQAAYTTSVRNVPSNTGALILSERTPTAHYQELQDGAGNELGSLDDRFTFQLQLLWPNGNTAIAYTITPQASIQLLEVRTLVEGTVYASSQTVALAFLSSFMASQALPGALVESATTPETKQGPAVGGSTPASVFVGMKFRYVYVSLYTGYAGILESEVVQEIVYSGNRNIEKGIPVGNSIIQQVGINAGRQTVTARCVATTATAAQAWIRTIRTALLFSQNASGVQAYEDPARVKTGFTFLPQVAGVVTGETPNVKLYEVTGVFSEILPDYGFN